MPTHYVGLGSIPSRAIKSRYDNMTTQKLSPGIHSIQSLFGEEFKDSSYCWMMSNGELWLSVILVKEENCSEVLLHRLLEAAKDFSDVVVIPETCLFVTRVVEQPLSRKSINVTPVSSLFVMRAAMKHGYQYSQKWRDEFGENTDVMVWRRLYSE